MEWRGRINSSVISGFRQKESVGREYWSGPTGLPVRKILLTGSDLKEYRKADFAITAFAAGRPLYFNFQTIVLF
jgi:hypothetical protein